MNTCKFSVGISKELFDRYQQVKEYISPTKVFQEAMEKKISEIEYVFEKTLKEILKTNNASEIVDLIKKLYTSSNSKNIQLFFDDIKNRLEKE